MNPKAELRSATINDLSQIVKIQNDIILEGNLTADLTPYLIDEKVVWFEETTVKPLSINILSVDDIVVGYVYLSPWRKGRAALKHVAEISYFLAKPYRGSGYGRMLLKDGILQARQNGFRTLMAILLDSNLPSIKLLESEGFDVTGHLPHVAELENSIAGQLIMMKTITP